MIEKEIEKMKIDKTKLLIKKYNKDVSSTNGFRRFSMIKHILIEVISNYKIFEILYFIFL